jgi:NhaP-type Na+/H+ or K+/H+ antiporter
MMDGYLDLAIIAIIVYLYGLVSARLRSSPVSGALVFLILGVLLGPAVLGWLSIVFAVLVLDAALPHGQQIVSVVTFTILLSILAHGVIASPLARRYGSWIKAH